MATPAGMTVVNNGIVGHNAGAIAPSAENTGAATRYDRRGEGVVENLFNGLQMPAIEGSYVVWTNTGARGTGVNLSSGTGTTYSAIQALLVVANTNPVGGPDVVLDYLKILIDTAVTGGTFWQIYHAMDTGNRYASGGTSMVGYAVNGTGGSPSGIVAATGVVVASAATGTVRDIGHNIILNGVGVANMELVIKFGCQETTQGTFTTPTTAVAQTVLHAPPVVVPPGWSYVMNEFQTGRSATGVGEFFLGAIVR